LFAFPPICENESADSAQTQVIDAANEKLSTLFMALGADTVTRAAFKTRSVTGGEHTVTVSIQTVDLTTTPAEPTGTIVGGGSPCSVTQTINGTGGDNTVYEVTFDNSFTLTKGTIYALVIEITTYAGSGLIQFSQSNDVAWPCDSYQSYTMVDTGGGWVADVEDHLLSCVGTASEAIWMPGVFPPGNDGSADSSSEDHSVGFKSMSTSSPDEVANIFTLPVPMRTYGPCVNIRADGNYTAKLYSDPTGTPTLLASVSFDKDFRVQTGHHMTQVLPWDSVVELDANTEYAVSLLFTTATASRVTAGNCNSTWMMSAYPGGANWEWATRNGSSGAFTKITTRRAVGIGLWINGVDDGAGGGSTTNVVVRRKKII
jgi:hypothetical protein